MHKQGVKMPSYKLHYFDLRGSAELSRMIFKLAGVEFEDIRYSRDEWPQHKTDMPLGTMPVLEVDGRRICQSMAIARYLAKEFGLFGSNNMEALLIDELMETFTEIAYKHLTKMYFEQNTTKKAELVKAFQTEDAPVYLNLIEERLKKNNGGNGFYVGSKDSVADLTLYNLMFLFRNWFGKFEDDLFEDRPLLKEHYKRVDELPNIAKWVKERPETEN